MMTLSAVLLAAAAAAAEDPVDVQEYRIEVLLRPDDPAVHRVAKAKAFQEKPYRGFEKDG